MNLAQPISAAKIEVAKVEEHEKNVFILKAKLEAPVGTVIRDYSNSGRKRTEAAVRDYLLIATMSSDLRTPAEGGSITDSVIQTHYYTPNYASIGDVQIIPGSTRSPQKAIESYAYFAKPGTYYVSAGGELILAEVQDAVYKIAVDRMPNVRQVDRDGI